MRPGEVTAMRGGDIDCTGDIWIYQPNDHKTKHHGHRRVIHLGPRAQEILRPWLTRDSTEYLFSPAEAVANRNAERRRSRVTPFTPSQAKRQPKRNPKRRPRDRYDKNAYSQAIARACKRAGVPHWYPNQLRHNVATRVRQLYGIEVARALLGHRSTATSEIYAEADHSRVADIMAEIG